MIQVIAALQPLLVGVVLIWAASLKLFSRQAAATASRSALARLVGEQRALPAYRLVGGTELTIGALLVLPPVLWFEAVAATALSIGFLGYLWYARQAAPNSSCGCLGAKQTPVSWRSFARSGFLVVASALAVPATSQWLDVVATGPYVAAAILLAEAAAVVTLSPELDSYWLLPLRRLRMRLTHPLTGGYGVPLLASIQQLQMSGAYRGIAHLLRSDVQDHWEQDEWRMVAYAAQYEGRPATAVFAVPRLRQEPTAVQVALVDEATGVALLHLDSRSDTATEADLGAPTDIDADLKPGQALPNPAYAG